MADDLDMDGSAYWGDVPSSSSRVDLAHGSFSQPAASFEHEEPTEPEELPEAENPENSPKGKEQITNEILGSPKAEHVDLPQFSFKPVDKPYSSIPTAPRTPKARVSTLRSSRVRKSAPAVHVESVSFSDPLGPLGGAANDESEIANAEESQESQDVTESTEGLRRLSVKATPTRNSISPPPPQTNAPPLVDHFEITVGDPIKIGDLTSAHTVYTVHTHTLSPHFSKAEASVTRRYRDFRWVYHALENNNPGVIVPPPPEKQAVGRFDEGFVEARRSALGNMLTKIAKHPILQNDPDFRIFLESDTFTVDIKSKQYQSLSHPGISGPEAKGFISSLGEAFSFTGKFVETDEYFLDKKAYIDTLESQFRYLAKALDLVVAQRKELSDSTAEFAAVLTLLSEVELSKSFSDLVESFAHTELRIRDLYYRQCMQDELSLATTLEEYIRLIGSIRGVFLQRQKAYFGLQNAEQELGKKRAHVDKVMRQGKTLQDKIAVLSDDIVEQDKRVLNARVAFDDVSKLIVSELGRFSEEKTRDFRNSVELFLENAVEAQKEAIEIWETFYQLSGFAGVSGGGGGGGGGSVLVT